MVEATSTSRAQWVEDLVRRHQGPVRGYLAYLGCPATLLDDLVQDVFLSVLASPHFEDHGPRRTAAFLRAVARNLLIKALQRERRRPLLEDGAAADRAWEEFQGDDEGEAYLSALRECLRAVRGQALEVLRLRYEVSVPRSQIGDRLGLSEAGVKSILVRTRKRLRDCIERRLER